MLPSSTLTMKYIYHEHARQGGIYRITNTANGKIYIGSTSEFKHRFMAHVNNLLANRHVNTYLQNEFNKYGEQAFEIEVLEVILDKPTRLLREQAFITEAFASGLCLNIRKDVSDTRAGKKNNEPANPLTDKRCKSPSEEVLVKRSAAIRKAKDNPESKERARQNCKNGLWKNHSCDIAVENTLTGEKVIIQGSLREWCLKNSLSYKAFHLMTQKKTKSSGGGWILI